MSCWHCLVPTMSCRTCCEPGFWFENETCPDCHETDRKINPVTRNSFSYDKWLKERAHCIQQRKPLPDGFGSELSAENLKNLLRDTSSQQGTRTTEGISPTTLSPAANKIPEDISPTTPSLEPECQMLSSRHIFTVDLCSQKKT